MTIVLRMKLYTNLSMPCQCTTSNKNYSGAVVIFVSLSTSSQRCMFLCMSEEHVLRVRVSMSKMPKKAVVGKFKNTGGGGGDDCKPEVSNSGFSDALYLSIV